ncbi:MAG: hypothetical protein LBL24_11065 [Bacteroidales bacterium]|jgi:hypothetical protein|nr:hypothetical protein [Bacteroidales bacterium]
MDKALRTLKAANAVGQNYDGSMPDSYEGVMPRYYIGFGDQSIDFDGDESTTFADEERLAEGHQFVFTIDNTGSAAVSRRLALCPAYFSDTILDQMTDNKGNAIDAIIKEGIVIGKAADNNALTVESENKTIDELLRFVLFNPTRFIGAKLQCNSNNQFGQSLNIRHCSPFRNLQDKTITPDTYKNSSQFDQTRVEIPLDNFQFDDQTLISWNILPQSRVTVTLYGGAILNKAKELNKKASSARANLVRTFGPGYSKR